MEHKYNIGDKLFFSNGTINNAPVKIEKITITYTKDKSTLHYGCKRLDVENVYYSRIIEDNLCDEKWIPMTNIEICKLLDIDVYSSELDIYLKNYLSRSKYKFENGKLFKRVNI